MAHGVRTSLSLSLFFALVIFSLVVIAAVDAVAGAALAAVAALFAALVGALVDTLLAALVTTANPLILAMATLTMARGLRASLSLSLSLSLCCRLGYFSTLVALAVGAGRSLQAALLLEFLQRCSLAGHRCPSGHHGAARSCTTARTDRSCHSCSRKRRPVPTAVPIAAGGGGGATRCALRRHGARATADTAATAAGATTGGKLTTGYTSFTLLQPQCVSRSRGVRAVVCALKGGRRGARAVD